MSKRNSSTNTNTNFLDEVTENESIELLELDIDLPINSENSYIQIKQLLEEQLNLLLIKPFRSIRAKSLILIWRCGLLKRKQSENNNEFIARFVALNSAEKLSLLAQTAHSQLVCSFSLSSDATLSDLLSHCSERAANLILADILYGRLINNFDPVKCAKSQATLIKRIEQLPL